MTFIVVGAVDEEGDCAAPGTCSPGLPAAFGDRRRTQSVDRITLGYKERLTTVTVRRPLAHSAALSPSPRSGVGRLVLHQAWAEAFNHGRIAFSTAPFLLQGWSSNDDGLGLGGSIWGPGCRPISSRSDGCRRCRPSWARRRGVGGLATPAYRSEKNTKLAWAFLKAFARPGPAVLRREDRDR
jgi:hypothetical protein